jgi:hypothetical protein
MASKDNIFSKHLPNIKLATRFDAEGREIAVSSDQRDRPMKILKFSVQYLRWKSGETMNNWKSAKKSSTCLWPPVTSEPASKACLILTKLWAE